MLWGDNRYERPIGVLFDVKNGRRIVGQLKLKQGDLFDRNVVGIADDAFVHIDVGDSLHGISETGMVSLLDCVPGGRWSSTMWDNFTIYGGDISFRYALFGNRHVTIDDKCVRGIQFTLEGVEESVFSNDKYEKFGLIEPDEELTSAIERNRPDYLKGNFVKGKAMVSYFTGDPYFLPPFETVLGTVYVERLMQIGSFGGMKDTPRVTVVFDDDPTTLDGAWEKMREVRQFFAWMMGCAPGWKDIQIFTSMLNERGIWVDTNSSLDVFGSNEWKQISGDTSQFGTLIDASRNPNHFADVMKKWLERNGNTRRKTANTRFFGSLRGTSDRCIEDSVVSAANTFDLLPDEDKPSAQQLPEEVDQVLHHTKNSIGKLLPDGATREDTLNALGRIRANRRLRDIVEHRAGIVQRHFGPDRLPRLKEVIRMAVKCRNYYTHGPSDKESENIEYSDTKVSAFLAESLEFIYCASELLLCGWDPRMSAEEVWNPLRGYAEAYNYKRSAILQLE